MKALKLKNTQNKLRNKFLKSGVIMIDPNTIFFSNDTLKSSVLKFWNWRDSFRFKRTFKKL